MPVASDTAKKSGEPPSTPPVDLAAVCPHAKKLKEGAQTSTTQAQSTSIEEVPGRVVSNGHSTVEENSTTDLKKNDEQQDAELKNKMFSLQLKLVLPGVSEPLNVLVSSSDTVNDLKQYVFERQECCFRTCISARFEGKKVEDYLTLNLVPGLKNGSVVRFVEEPYSQREVRLHICRLRDLLNGPQLKGIFNGTNTDMSLSFLSGVMGENPEVEAAKLSKPDIEDLHNDPTLKVPQFCLPSSPPSLLPFYPENFLEKWPDSLKHLGYSQWNPPPNYRRMKGDLLYIDVVTLEGEEHCITACPTGFYLNKCQGHDVFDPTPQKTSYLNHNLAALLFHISPLFKKNFSVIQKLMKKRSPFELVPLLRPGAQPWLVPRLEHTQEQVPVEGVLVSRLGLDEHIFGQLKDWNGEFQQAKDLPQESAADKITRQKNLSRMFGEFLHAAVKGAVNVVEGNISPVNPSDDKKNYIYLWNNIFFSLAFDTAQINYKKYGGDEAAHRACAADINGVAYLNLKKVEGIHTVETAVIDIKGNRVVAQAVVPGLLQSDPESFIVYGSMDCNNSCFRMDEHFTEVLRKSAEALHIREHRVLGPEGEVLVLPSSVEFKGMKGTDGRYYVMDLYKLFPEDANFMDEEWRTETASAGNTDSKEGTGGESEDQKPGKLRHKLMTVRPELLEKFIKNKYMAFVNVAVRHIQASHGTKDSSTATEETDSEENTGEPPVDVTPEKDSRETPLMDPLQHMASDPVPDQSDSKMKEAIQKLKEVGGDVVTQMEGVVPKAESAVLVDSTDQGDQKKAEMEEKVLEGVRKAAAEVGSSLKDGFEILFNVDYYAPDVKHVDSEEQLGKDKKLLRELAGFLSNKVISIFIYDCAELMVTPWDGEMLTSVMHSRGINMRYLGGIANGIELLKEHVHLEYLYNIVVMEMVLRCAKRLFRRELQRIPYHSSGVLLAHLLNCFLGKVEAHSETAKKKAKKKKKTSQSHLDPSTTTTASMWAAICKETSEHFRYKMEFACADSVCEALSVTKVPLLRGICNKVGIQLFLKNYSLSETTIFTEDDVAGIFPVIKHAAPRV
jgi:protein TIF31